jgi:hypothetical protein
MVQYYTIIAPKPRKLVFLPKPPNMFRGAYSCIWRVHEYEKLQVQEIENKAVLRRFAQHIHEA